MLVDDISANYTDSLQTLQSQLSAKLNPYSPPSGLIASKCLVVNPMQLEGFMTILSKLFWHQFITSKTTLISSLLVHKNGVSGCYLQLVAGQHHD